MDAFLKGHNKTMSEFSDVVSCTCVGVDTREQSFTTTHGGMRQKIFCVCLGTSAVQAKHMY